MNKKKTKKATNKIVAIIIGAFFIIVLGLFIIPIDTARVGECGGTRTIRLSVVNGDFNKFETAKKDAQERRASKAEYLRQHPGMAMGCSLGPVYKLYLI
jgi:hypothetical protein